MLVAHSERQPTPLYSLFYSQFNLVPCQANPSIYTVHHTYELKASPLAWSLIAIGCFCYIGTRKQSVGLLSHFVKFVHPLNDQERLIWSVPRARPDFVPLSSFEEQQGVLALVEQFSPNLQNCAVAFHRQSIQQTFQETINLSEFSGRARGHETAGGKPIT